jgi:hypothetical protein
MLPCVRLHRINKEKIFGITLVNFSANKLNLYCSLMSNRHYYTKAHELKSDRYTQIKNVFLVENYLIFDKKQYLYVQLLNIN